MQNLNDMTVNELAKEYITLKTWSHGDLDVTYDVLPTKIIRLYPDNTSDIIAQWDYDYRAKIILIPRIKYLQELKNKPKRYFNSPKQIETLEDSEELSV